MRDTIKDMMDTTIIGVLLIMAGLVWMAIASTGSAGGVRWGDEPRASSPRQQFLGTLGGIFSGLVLVAIGLLAIFAS